MMSSQMVEKLMFWDKSFIPIYLSGGTEGKKEGEGRTGRRKGREEERKKEFINNVLQMGD